MGGDLVGEERRGNVGNGWIVVGEERRGIVGNGVKSWWGGEEGYCGEWKNKSLKIVFPAINLKMFLYSAEELLAEVKRHKEEETSRSNEIFQLVTEIERTEAGHDQT